jgi:hypothetical protein
MIRKLLLTFSGVMLLVAATAGTAHARTAPTSSPLPVNGPQTASILAICAQAGNGYCLNDWNGAGSGGAVRMYNPGVTNDGWTVTILAHYCNNGLVSNICPFPVGSGLNTQFDGDEIFQMDSDVSNACIGTDSNEMANLGACPPVNGSGKGSNIWVLATSTCGASAYYFENVYWSGQHGNGVASSLISGGSIGAQAYVLGDDPATSCWSYVAT